MDVPNVSGLGVIALPFFVIPKPQNVCPPSTEYPAQITILAELIESPVTVKLNEFNDAVYPKLGARSISIYGVIGLVAPAEL